MEWPKSSLLPLILHLNCLDLNRLVLWDLSFLCKAPAKKTRPLSLRLLEERKLPILPLIFPLRCLDLNHSTPQDLNFRRKAPSKGMR